MDSSEFESRGVRGAEPPLRASPWLPHPHQTLIGLGAMTSALWAPYCISWLGSTGLAQREWTIQGLPIVTTGLLTAWVLDRARRNGFRAVLWAGMGGALNAAAMLSLIGVGAKGLASLAELVSVLAAASVFAVFALPISVPLGMLFGVAFICPLRVVGHFGRNADTSFGAVGYSLFGVGAWSLLHCALLLFLVDERAFFLVQVCRAGCVIASLAVAAGGIDLHRRRRWLDEVRRSLHPDWDIVASASIDLLEWTPSAAWATSESEVLVRRVRAQSSPFRSSERLIPVARL